ncbi:MAG: glycoside hydrolase family 9 protein [Litorimonas sp.]
MKRFLTCLATLALIGCSQGLSPVSAQTPPIIVDQFGYLPALDKIAIIKDPEIGFDSRRSFSPSNQYAVVNIMNGQVVFTGQPKSWKNGKTDEVSGDRVWHFDFSDVRAPGRYVVRDLDRKVDSYSFEISPTVYTPVLKTAFKTLYLQRAGYEKTPQLAGPWADKASHLRKGQDPQARLFNRMNDASTERDLRGGWYDAGDYNKYTSWTANYVTWLLGAYLENPNIWTDDFDIPESGNGTPDLLDEVKWGLDWLERMQNEDGSMLSVMSLGEGSPPSSAKEASRYGPPNSSTTVTSSGAFAIAAEVYSNVPGFEADAKRYADRADKAWRWAEANPNVKFWNNDPRSNSESLAAGQQEVEADRFAKKRLIAAIHMFVLTDDPYFVGVIGGLYDSVKPMSPNTPDGFEGMMAADLLYYARQPKTPARFAARIKRDYAQNVLNGYNAWPTVVNKEHAYRSYVDGYWWGSNSTKARRGSVYTQAIVGGVGERSQTEYLNAASDYLHYIHGVNPLNKVYLSNMSGYGAENSVTQFYHAWFKKGTVWDAVGVSKYGPAPGFLVGGPNQGYSRDDCCQTVCGGYGAKMCKIPVKSPPGGQPPAKSYADFNEGWPINSWEVTENSNSYQIAYIRLLSKFAR